MTEKTGTAGRDLERDAKSEEDIYSEARDRLQIAVEAEKENRWAAKADLEFREGAQWDKQPYTTAEAMNQPEMTINLTDALVRRVVNNIKNQRPRGKCHPVGDGADIKKAALINGIGRHVENRSDAGLAYDIGAEMAVTMGWGYWRLLVEYVAPKSFRKDLRVVAIRNPFSVYMDPAAMTPTAQDADWALITLKIKRTEYKRLYPRMDNIEWHDTGRSDDRDWEDREEIRLAEYFRIRETADTLYQLRDAEGREYTRWSDELPSEESLAAARIEIVDERESARRVVEWFRLNGTRVVDRETLPGTFIPIIRCEGNAVDIDGRIKRRGMVRSMQDPARMINYGETAKIKRLGLAPQAPWIAAEGQLEGHPEWTDSNNTAHPVLIYKPITLPSALGGEIMLPPPQRQPPAQIEQGFSDLVMGMRANLAAVAGMEHQPAVDTQGEVISGAAIRRRQQMSDQSHSQYYDNQVLAIAHTWRIMLEYVPHVLTVGQMQRIIGDDGSPEMIQISEELKRDLMIGTYDVVMDTGPGYETKREEGAEALMGLLRVPSLAQLVTQVGADLIFRSLDHPYMQELADRIVAQTPEGIKKIMATMDPQARAVVQALSNQNAQLKQAIEAAKSGLTKEQLKIHADRENAELKAGVDVFIEGMKHGHDIRESEGVARGLVTEGESNG